MTKKQAERYNWLTNALADSGISQWETDKLLRCEKVLHTWAEHECNGAIQRDEETNIPYWYNTNTGRKLYRTADRETGALKRAAAIAKAHNVKIYHQGDPRGCSLYIIRRHDIPKGSKVESCYSRGIAICID